jgi:hypothetical protein
VNDGCSLEAATKIIRQDTGHSKSMMKHHCRANDRYPKRQHEAYKLSKSQENHLVSVFEVYCLMDEARLVRELVSEVAILFSVKVSQKLCHSFIARNKNQLSVQKMKYLTSKKIHVCISSTMVEIMRQVGVVWIIFGITTIHTMRDNKKIVVAVSEM